MAHVTLQWQLITLDTDCMFCIAAMASCFQGVGVFGHVCCQ